MWTLFNVLLLSLHAWARVITSSEHLERDVCIIGGGSSGTYSAIRLQQMGMSVALIERNSRLGGAVHTYTDPESGLTHDSGVQTFSNLSVVRDFFDHFNVPLRPLGLEDGPGDMRFVNFERGRLVRADELIIGNMTADLIKYAKQQAKYPSMYEQWNLPDPVPEDLLMPYRDFVKKHDLDAYAYTAFIYLQGIANIVDQPAMYVMKYQDREQINSLITGTFVHNGINNNQLLFDKAEAELGSNVFLESNVRSVKRHTHGVEVSFSTPDGVKKVKASKLLITIPPLLSKLDFLDTDEHERKIFGEFNHTYYWDAMIRNTGIPDGVTAQNMNPDLSYNVPSMPGTYTFLNIPIPNVKATYYSSPFAMSDDEVKEQILSTLAVVRETLGYPVPEEEPEFVAFHRNVPYLMEVSVEAIENGFYEELLALQGEKNTWYTGHTWMNHASATIWRYTEEHVLPHLVKKDFLRKQDL